MGCVWGVAVKGKKRKKKEKREESKKRGSKQRGKKKKLKNVAVHKSNKVTVPIGEQSKAWRINRQKRYAPSPSAASVMPGLSTVIALGVVFVC